MGEILDNGLLMFSLIIGFIGLVLLMVGALILAYSQGLLEIFE